MSNVDVLQLVTIKTQVVTSKFHSRMFICWGFIAINDGFLVDSMNP